MAKTRTWFALVCVVPLILLGLGCYKTEYPLGSADKAAVDPAYAGDYVFIDGNKTTNLVIRNIDNHLYYVEWTSSDDNKANRMTGYTSDVNGVTFANLRGLTDDGSIDNKFLIMRVSLSADHAKLTLRNLKDDFFKDKNVDSSAAQEKVIAANLQNEQMYDGDAVVATRVAKPAATTQAIP